MKLHPAAEPEHTAESSLLDSPELLRDLPRQVVAITDLRASLAPRERREDPAHVRLLAETGGTTEPLLVHRPTMRVIDGAHRLRAAAMRGRTEVEVRFFDGSEDDAFVLAVHLNVRHGLPLTLDERKSAAERVIRSHPHWSDRVLAQRTGLSPKTVAKIRGRTGERGAGTDQRLGGDGRLRPVSSIEGRRRAAALLARHPGMSLREVARRTGLSAGTVRDVRDRLAGGRDPVPHRLRGVRERRTDGPPPPRRAAAGRTADPVAEVRPLPAPAGRPRGARTAAFDAGAAVRKLARDPALRATESGRQLLRVLLATEMAQPRWGEIAEAIPAHCVPLVREVLLSRCEDWRKLAALVPRESGK